MSGAAFSGNIVHRILVIIGLLPIFAALIARQAARGRARRVENEHRSAPDAMTACELAREVLRVGGVEAEVVAQGSGWFPAIRGPLRIPAECAEAGDVVSLGRAVQEAGMRLLAGREPKAVETRLQVLRFGAAAPAMAVIVAIFAGIVMHWAFMWILVGVVLISGFASLLQLLGTSVELHAAVLGSAAMRKIPAMRRLADLEAIEAAARAAAWRRCLPASLAWMLP
jgi:hypothetical protein